MLDLLLWNVSLDPWNNQLACVPLQIGKSSLVQTFLGILIFMLIEGRLVSIGICGYLNIFQANTAKSLFRWVQRFCSDIWQN